MQPKACSIFPAAFVLLVLPASPQGFGGTFAQRYAFRGAMEGDRMGFSVAGAGDVNRDGVPDLIVGAPFANPNGKTDAGSAFVYSGVDGAILRRIEGEIGSTLYVRSGDVAGYSVAGAGDVDGDGFADVIVGAPGASASRSGSASVYSGVDGIKLWQLDGADRGDDFGASVAGAGDVDGDGFADLIVGAPLTDPGQTSDAGTVFIYSGKDGMTLWRLDGSFGFLHSRPRGGELGRSVAGVGDLNGDGFVDMIVGERYADGKGAALVYVSRPALVEYGVGLEGSGGFIPKIGTRGEPPRLGSSSVKIEVSEAVGGTICVIATSLSRAQLAMHGVTLYGDFVTAGAFSIWTLSTTGAPHVPGVGVAALPIQIPNDPAMIGFRSYWQGFVMDFGSPIGMSHTPGLEVMVIR